MTCRGRAGAAGRAAVDLDLLEAGGEGFTVGGGVLVAKDDDVSSEGILHVPRRTARLATERAPIARSGTLQQSRDGSPIQPRTARPAALDTPSSQARQGSSGALDLRAGSSHDPNKSP